jgi:Xaa-Pro aminopeptidase
MTDTPLLNVRLGAAFYRGNVSRIQARLGPLGLDGLLLLDAHNVIYASGFFHSVSERPIGLFIPATGDPALLVPLLEQEHAAETWIRDVRLYFEFPGEEHPVLWMARECTGGGKLRLGVDSLSLGSYRHLVSAGFEPILTPLVTEMRYVKQPEEIALITQAARYADYCLEVVRDQAGGIVTGGGTELDILNACLTATATKMRQEIDNIFALRGGSIVGTVHSGPQAALPHGQPGRRKPQPAETLIAGIGAMVGGYCAESGATFVLGEPSADTMRCLRAAADCNDAAIHALRAGATCASVNEAALDVLHGAGLEDFIRHRIGHGMGLQGHEAPWLAPGDQTILAPGMVFSNEPGIYRPGVDGYRTINTMIVTEGEAVVPSRFLAAHPPEKRVIAL